MNDLPNDDPAEDGPSSDEPLTNGLPHYESFPFPGPEIHAVPGEVHDEASMIAGETMDQVGAVVGDSAAATPPKTGEDTGRSAFLVGAGILISRIVGLVRQRVFAHYFGLSAAGDAFSAAFRIPNFLQNIFGEGALSASFIPVYAKLLAHDDEEEAARVANAVLGMLALVTSLTVNTGVFATPYIIDAIAPGFQ